MFRGKPEGQTRYLCRAHMILLCGNKKKTIIMTILKAGNTLDGIYVLRYLRAVIYACWKFVSSIQRSTVQLTENEFLITTDGP